MVKVIRWLVVNGAFAALVYFATVCGSARALYWVTGLSIFLAAFTALLLIPQVAVGLAKSEKWPSTPYPLDFTYDLVIITALVTYGSLVTATVYAFHTMVLGIITSRVDCIRRQAAQPEESNVGSEE